ncbi:hypothetical protein RhiirC2_800216 [Rhizophagus irregularis]|uniref:Uncharacterized protein n=1 Tax=Rhizophagus irregularis TaxID=588596 RepID=A0A2N1M3Z7_9GLOM|nr:hypothetical protein RhiirC2_800216 [Rhizophagus irregularis]
MEMLKVIAKDYYMNISDYNRINICCQITQNPITKNFMIITDYYDGNILVLNSCPAITGDLGLSKSAIESLDDENEIYGIIPYVAPVEV